MQLLCVVKDWLTILLNLLRLLFLLKCLQDGEGLLLQEALGFAELHDVEHVLRLHVHCLESELRIRLAQAPLLLDEGDYVIAHALRLDQVLDFVETARRHGLRPEEEVVICVLGVTFFGFL